MKDNLMTTVAHLSDVEVPEFVLPKHGFVRPLQLLPPYGPLPISKSTLYSWVASGVLPPLVPIGKGRIRGFRVEEIREFLADPNQRATWRIKAFDGSGAQYRDPATAPLLGGSSS